MAQEILLRHIFKHGLLSHKSKKATPHTDGDDDPLLAAQTTKSTAKTSSSYLLKAQDAPDASLPVKIEAQHQTRRGITSCASSCSSCSSSSETIHTAEAPMPIIQQAPSPTTISVRDLLHAVMEEANIATAMHMETLDMTLALLNAIQGMSATVDVLKREMEQKRKVCEQMRKELLSFEEVVREMGLIE